MFKIFTPVGKSNQVECWSEPMGPMSFEQLSKKLEDSEWVPLTYTVPNFAWLQQHISEFKPSQQFNMVQSVSGTSLFYGATWFIVTV